MDDAKRLGSRSAPVHVMFKHDQQGAMFKADRRQKRQQTGCALGQGGIILKHKLSPCFI
ncbi:hypothetical protein D3C80_1614290 [compost metagenome]